MRLFLQPLTLTTANPNAATAAASAFMSASNQQSNKTLSSAAAAAALRARPHTPTNVAEVQTKRTVRRSASVSSSGSARPGPRLANGHTQLERQGSTASMTERTFRSPSPRRSSTPVAQEPKPPVPQIPDGHKNSTTKSRVSGTGMQNFRTASQKMRSDAPSWHAQPTGDMSNVRTSDAIMRTTKPQSPDPTPMVGSPGRPDSRSSVNFSYPTIFRPQSPPTSPISPRSPASAPHLQRPPSSNSQRQNSQQLVYDPNSRRMVPKPHVEESIGHQTKQMEEKAPRKRRDSALRREGSQSTKGTTARPRETTVSEDRGLREPQSPERSTKPRLPAVEEVYPIEVEERGEPETQASITTNLPTRNVPAEPSELTKPMPQNPPSSASIDSGGHASRSQPSHTAQPSIAKVHDESTVVNERPRVGDRRPSPPQSVLNALDAVPTRQALFENTRGPEANKKPTYETPQDTPASPPIDKSEVLEMNNELKAIIAENRPVAALAVENGQLRRSSSNSPARQARFAPGPTENLAVRHAPLPRSASPIKSAMKHTNSILRESSPSDNASDPQGSSAGPNQKDESAVSRKKSVRVSFNDQGTVIVGDTSLAVEAESPAAQSPQGGKRAWFSNIGRSKKKEIALEDDEIMKPRPALPSFGSIRDKKTRETGERPLVRPLEPAYPPAVSSSPELRPQSSSTLNDSEMTEETSLGQSSDQAIGAVLSQDQTSRNAANISRFREPLPPVVTSVEGCGYGSDSLQGSDDEEPDSAMEIGIPSMPSSALGTQLTEPDTDDGDNTKTEPTPQEVVTQPKYIPEVSITQPSPMRSEQTPQDNGPSSAQYFDLPGGFPDSESDPKATRDLPANGAVFEPNVATIQPSQAEDLPQTTLDTTTPILGSGNSTEEESDGSIYSDAYEDIPDLDSGGFMSLDAIVDGPANQEQKQKLLQTMRNSEMPILNDQPRSDAAVEGSPVNQNQLSPPQDTNDWEQAKAFWRGLTAEKRRQLELEAAEEAGADGDREEVTPPVRRNSSKKKSSGPVQTAPQTAAAHDKPAQPKPQQHLSLGNGQVNQSKSAQPRVSMRKTLRANEHAPSTVQPSSRQTLRAQAPAPIQPVSSRDHAAKPHSRSSLSASSGAKAAAQPRPSLQRQGSDASDSSFKRSRRPLSGNSTFRTTMRQTSPMQSQRGSTLGSGRFSLRSLSPAGSSTHREANGNFATSSPGGMRRTMRSNSESSHEGKRSSVHFPLFSRTPKSPSKASKWTSRFDNSSDEDGEALPEFQSRIRTSTDEDESRPGSSRETKPLGKAILHSSNTAPSLSRPAPVPELEEDSPELPDSDDEFMPSLLHTPQRPAATNGFAGSLGATQSGSGAIGTSTLGRSRSGRGELATSIVSPTLPTKERHGSFLNILRRNKKVDQPGKIQRPMLAESAARRDTKLERDLEQLRDLREQLKDLRSERPPSPKLRKRPSVSRNGSGGLPRPTSAGQLLGRSATTDAIGPPALGDRRSFSHGMDPNDESVEFENASLGSSGQPKKKKFRALRRMFKLDE